MQHTPLTYDEWKQLSKPSLKGKVHLLLDGLSSIENAGLILRSAEAAHVEKVIFLHPQFDWDKQKLKRISRSTSEQIELEVITLDDTFDKITFLAKYQQAVALEYTNISTSIYDFNCSFPLLIVVGNENRGISAALLSELDQAVHIPLFGNQSSINVSNAVTAALVWINHQRMGTEGA